MTLDEIKEVRPSAEFCLLKEMLESGDRFRVELIHTDFESRVELVEYAGDNEIWRTTLNI